MPLLVMKGYITLVLNKTIGGGDGEIILCHQFFFHEQSKNVVVFSCEKE